MHLRLHLLLLQATLAKFVIERVEAIRGVFAQELGVPVGAAVREIKLL